MGTWAASAGTKLPTCARYTISATCRDRTAHRGKQRRAGERAVVSGLHAAEPVTACLLQVDAFAAVVGAHHERDALAVDAAHGGVVGDEAVHAQLLQRMAAHASSCAHDAPPRERVWSKRASRRVP